jgi:hypothetical protein
MVDPNWRASTGYAVGDVIVDSNGNIVECTTPGMSGAAAPAWATTVGTTTRDAGVIWTLRIVIKRDTTKLVEEAKLYWTVQSLIAPVVGYLLSHLTSGEKLWNSIFCVLAIVPIIVGAVYNLAGAGYIYEARSLAGLPIRRDFFCAWMATAYVLLGGVTFGLLGYFVGSSLHLPPRVGLIIGLGVGCTFLWFVSRTTYRRVENECSRQNILGFDHYLSDVKRLYDLKRWKMAILFFLLLGVILLAIRLLSAPVSADQTGVAPPQSSAPLLEAAADGVQIYTCEAKGSLFQWTLTAPQANLFDKQGRQIGTHFAGPTWKMADGSAVVGEVIAKADAPEKDAIQWLLLRVKAHEGQGSLADAAFVRRMDTKGGVAPTAGCDAGHISEQARMRYSAIYQFFSAPKG